MLTVSKFLILIALVMPVKAAFAQDDSFAPPAPPAIEPEAEFDENDPDMMEVTEDGRPPPPPATGLPSGIPGSMPPLPPRPDYRPGGSGNFSGSNNNGGKAPAVQFRIVEGEYWQKGKKRPRGQKNRN